MYYLFVYMHVCKLLNYGYPHKEPFKKEGDTDVGLSLQEIMKSKEKLDLLKRSGELQSSSLDGDVQKELAMLQQTIENIKNNLEEVEVIKKRHGGDIKAREMFTSLFYGSY